MPLMLWGGKLLIVGGQLAIDPNCCCQEGPAKCCGRWEPGEFSNTGPDYYPLTLHARITRGSCAEPVDPLDLDLTWNPDIGAPMHWEAEVTGITGITHVWLNCGEPTWRAEFGGGICECAGGGGGSCPFDMTPTLTDGQCNPVDLTGSASMVGLMCCGNIFGPSTMTLEVWE